MQTLEQVRAVGLPCFPCRQDKAPLVNKGQSWREAAQLPLDRLRPAAIGGLPIPQGVVVIDLDLYKGVTREQAEHALGCQLPWDASLIQSTQSGGEHHAFRVSWPVKQGDSIGITGLDTRVEGLGYISFGQGYTPANMFGVLRMAYPEQLPEMPDAARSILERVAHEPTTPAELPEGNRDVEQLKEALAHITPHCSRTEWRNIGMALKHQFHDDYETGFALFDAWSLGNFCEEGEPLNYDGDDQEHQWGSFKSEGGITIATLYYEASRHGWTPPAGFDAAAVFGQGSGNADAIDDIIANGGNPKETKRLASLVNGDPLLSAVLQRELKEADLLTAALRKALEPRGPKAQPPAAAEGQVLPPSIPMQTSMWAAFQTKGKEERPKGTRDNFNAMMNAYGIGIEYNEVSKEVRISGPGVPQAGALHDEAALSHIDHLANLNEYPKADNRSMIMLTANEHSFNPVQQYIDAAIWDGHDYIGDLFNCLTLEEDEDQVLAGEMFRRWFLGAVAIGTGRASAMEYVLTLVDTEGGAGKTRFFCSLAPVALRKDSVTLDTTNRDSVKIATSYWLVELGELDGTFNRSEQARIKAHLSSEFDEMRLAYGRAYMRYPRRTAYFASVNSTTFLTDSSGNRRFWPIRVKHCNHEHGINVQQVWAQAQACIRSGHRWHLTTEENKLITARNEEFRSHSRVSDSLSQAIPEGAPEVEHLTVTAILLRVGIPNPLKSDLNEAAGWLRKRKYREVKRTGIKGFMIPRIAVTLADNVFKPQIQEVKP